MHIKETLGKSFPGIPSSFRSAPGEGRDQFGWRWALRTAWRRKWAILLPALALAALAAAIVSRIPPVYEGRAEILVDPRPGAVAGDARAGGSGSADAPSLGSQVRVLRSRNLAYKVAEASGLDEDPEFNPQLRPLGPLARAADWVRAEVAALWGPPPAAPGERTGAPTDRSASAGAMQAAATKPGTGPAVEKGEAPPPGQDAETAGEALDAEPSPEPGEVAAAIVDRFLDAVRVELVPESHVLAITVSSRSPERAAQLANKLAETFILDQLDAKYEATQRATGWLTDKIAELRRNVATTEQAVEKFRAQSGLLQGTGGTMATQQASDLGAQLSVVRNAREEAEQRLATLRRAIQGGAAAGLAEGVLTPAARRLLDQQEQARRKLADLAKEYGDRHPAMIAAKAELADVQAKVQKEADRSVEAIESEVEAARRREAALSRSLQQLRGKLGQSAGAEIQLRTLEREAESSRSMLEAFLARFEQATARLDTSIDEMDARVISRADVPLESSWPPAGRIVATTFLLGALLSALVVFILEQLDRGFRSGEQVERETGLRPLGLVPAIRSSGAGKGPASRLLRDPSSMFGESIRSLYTGILLSPGPLAPGTLSPGTEPGVASPAAMGPPRTLLVTSSQPNEGKTTISVCLGRMRALAGHGTVVVEADLRRPSMHRVLGVERGPGLTELLLGEKELDEVLYRDPESGAAFVFAGKLAPDPTEVLSSARLGAVLDELARRFELVVVDSPPLVAVSDSRLLARRVDAAVFVVRWASTPREVVRLAVRQLEEAGARVSGVVLSMVDSRKHARYGFGDSAYYYGPVRRYYSS